MFKLIFIIFILFVLKKLYKLLSEWFIVYLLSNEVLIISCYLVFNFCDKSYSVDEGGFYLVEMVIC